MLGRQFPKLKRMLCDSAADLLAFTSFPISHWKKIWSTNPPGAPQQRGETPHRRGV
jgi:putative transposase